MDLIDKYKEQYKGIFAGPVQSNDIDSLLNLYGITDKAYRLWLVETGGGPIGPDWYDGIEELSQSQEKLKSENWNITGFVIGWDGAGNPLVLLHNGAIVTEDHNFGGVHEVASSFEKLLSVHVSS